MERFRHFILGIAEVVGIGIVAISMIFSGGVAYRFSQLITNKPDQELVCLAVGALFGLLISALPAFLVLALAEIAHNSRRTRILLKDLVATSVQLSAQGDQSRRSFRIREAGEDTPGSLTPHPHRDS